MALADIIARIASDASAQADEIVADAEKRAATIIDAAREVARHESAQMLERAQTESERDAETIVVKARLAARDALVSTQREVIDEALAATAAALAALPDERYAAWLAKRITAAARGGDALALGTLDQGRQAEIREAIAAIAPDLPLAMADEPAPFERGALLLGDRVRADLSLEAIVADQRDSLELAVARVLFTEEA